MKLDHRTKRTKGYREKLAKAQKATWMIEVATTAEGITDLARMQMLTRAMGLNFHGRK